MTRFNRWLTAAFGFGAAIIAVFPFYWMLRTAVAPADELTSTGLSLFPLEFDFSNTVRAWEQARLGEAMLNSLTVTLGILFFQLLTCIPAAYALAKFRFRGSGLVLGLVLTGLLIPHQATMIPTFVGINLAGLGDTRIGLVLPFVTSVIGIFMLRQQMLSIPDAIMEAVGKRPDLIMSGLGQLGFWVDSFNPATVDETTLPEGYQKQFLGAGQVDGETYLAPFQISAPAMLVNKKLLAEAGVQDPTAVKDYDAMLEAARKITAKTGKPSVHIATDGLPDWFTQALVQGAGEKFVAEDGSFGFDTEKGRKAIGILSQLQKENLLLPVGLDDGEAQFSAGNVAFHMNTTSRMAKIVEKTPASTDWMPIDLPTLDGAAGTLPAGGNGWIVISEDSCAAAYSGAMINEMLTKEASLLSSGKDRSYIPVNKLAADELLAGDDVAPQTKYAWTYSKPLTIWGGFDGERTAQVNETIQTMIEKLSTGAAAEDVVPATAKAINGMVRK